MSTRLHSAQIYRDVMQYSNSLSDLTHYSSGFREIWYFQKYQCMQNCDRFPRPRETVTMVFCRTKYNFSDGLKKWSVYLETRNFPEHEVWETIVIEINKFTIVLNTPTNLIRWQQIDHSFVKYNLILVIEIQILEELVTLGKS